MPPITVQGAMPPAKRLPMSSEPPETFKPARAPAGLSAGGRALWRSVANFHELDGVQLVQLTEACRMKDRCDKLDAALRGDGHTWMRLVVDIQSDGDIYELRITNALAKANETANSMKQLLAALRLPDEASGKRPQRRGPRGAQKPTQAGGADAKGKGTVSSIERARQRAERAQQTGTS